MTPRSTHVVRQLSAALALGVALHSAVAFTPSTAPVATLAVPGNLLLALSVEWPTGHQASYTGAYDATVTTYYEGYFDNRKCYRYDSDNQVFVPRGNRDVSGAGHAGCISANPWSGNVLNWLTMTNLDQFRSVMTGGTRDNFSDMSSTFEGDAANQTVLIRSFSERAALNPDKTLPNIGVPSGLQGLSARSAAYGSKLIILPGAPPTWPTMGSLDDQAQKCPASATSNFGTNTTGTVPANGGVTAAAGGCFNIRVQVCVKSGNVDLEANCVGGYGPQSGRYAKPQGLIQEYAEAIRFGAMGYLKDGRTPGQRDGGVLRAAMKSVGAIRIGEGNIANANKEWDPSTGFILANPNPADANNSAVSNSGVINYLNKFGYTAGYKDWDPASELFYAAQRYLRNLPVLAEYTSGLTTEMKDGFPVITNFSDPIVRSCQKNFILGIGDIYTWCDGNLPGGDATYLSAMCGTNSPTDTRINVENLMSSVTTMEGSGATTGPTLGRGSSPYIAGLAWWANVNDIRPDLAGKQTISTYWVDVLENNNGGLGIGAKTQYWLAAKYGGFRQELVPSNGTNPNTERLSWDANNDGQPDTLFAGNNPISLRNSLRAAFADIVSRADDSSSASAAVTSNRQTSASQVIYAGYNPKNWSGRVRACAPSESATRCQNLPTWDATWWFNSSYTAGATPKLTASSRKIFTSWQEGGSFSDMAFKWTSLLAPQKAILNGGGSNGPDLLNYLRGDRSLEGTRYRVRDPGLLGDVVNSNITYLAGSGPVYRGSNFPGHAAYRATNAARPAVAYVGANDGMLHAFDADTGKELWAYIPGKVLSKLPSLAAPSYDHQYTVDATAMVGDTQKANNTWRTMLVGGLGGGGKGYYALDITNQATFGSSSETTLADMPMWEFTDSNDSDLGYTYYEPYIDPVSGAFRQLAKVADATTATGVWRAILNNGYGSSANKAILYFLNTETGVVSIKLEATSSGSGDNGLSSPSPVDTDGDGLIDTVYAGDLRGALHKFQFSKSVNVGGASQYVLASAGDASGAWRYLGAVFQAGKAITVAPTITRSCTGSGQQILFGTGKLNESADFTDTSTNVFYAVNDANNAVVGNTASLTVAGSQLASISITTTNGVRTWNSPNLTGKKGWKMTLDAGERLLSNPTLSPDTGAVLFGTSTPAGDVCTAGSAGFIMAVGVCTGGSDALTVTDGGTTTTVGGVGVAASGILKISNTYTGAGGTQVVVCNQSDCQGGASGSRKLTSLRKGAPNRARLSWREILR